MRQGDPLSPLLFVMAANLLQTIVNEAYDRNLLLHPIHNNFAGKYPIVQYADDTLIIMPGDAVQLLTLKGQLRTFADSTGLKVNFEKYFLVPLNMDQDRAVHLAATMGCQVGTMPFTYLGLPLGTTKPSVTEFLPILTRIEKRMMGINKLLSYDGRLLMVNSVLSSLPTFYMCTLQLPASIIDQIDKYKKHELWDNGDINRKGSCLVAWKKACRPKNQEGLGIINLRAQNNALLLKFLHKFYNQEDLPWVQMTWQHLYTR